MVTIDAQGKSIGRVASEAAKILIGKDKTDFVKNKVMGDSVTIINAKEANIHPNKWTHTTFIRHSGYPGGLKKETLEKAVVRKSFGFVFKTAVYGMLPKNKLRDRIIKKLVVKE